MKRITFELIQHTPIIHFQADDSGATLRASEVKPKLDKYLIKRIGTELLKSKGLFIPGREDALDYKLCFRIKNGTFIERYLPVSRIDERKKGEIEREKKVKVLSSTPLFSNEKYKGGWRQEWSKMRLALRSKGSIIGEILFKHRDFCEMIKSHLEDFFLLHNFGMRQTKGFGSYTISSILGQGVDKSQKYISKKMKDLGVIKCLKSHDNDIGYQFSQILKFHNEIKTGGKNSSSKLKNYLKKLSKDIEWEKPLLLNILKRRTCNTSNVYYIRALLGLHEHFEFPLRNNKEDKKIIKVSHKDIDRFASPIVYKPVGRITYIILADIPDKMFGTEFTFSMEHTQSRRVKTPCKNTFELTKFLEWVEYKDLVKVEKLL